MRKSEAYINQIVAHLREGGKFRAGKFLDERIRIACDEMLITSDCGLRFDERNAKIEEYLSKE